MGTQAMTGGITTNPLLLIYTMHSLKTFVI